jgi:signal transduction histidine kinase
MRLAEFIQLNKERLLERWQQNAVERLSLDLEESQLRNDLPHFVDDMIEALRDPSGRWPHDEGAKKHGRHRLKVGVNIGSLTAEMMLVGETTAEVADELGCDISNRDLLHLMAIVGRGAAASVTTYAGLRDKELADQSAQHFSFIAHEIRNPLQNARLAAHALAIVAEIERTKHMERLDRALSQLGELVDDSLIEARLYSEPHLNLQRVDVRKLIEYVCDDLTAQTQERDLTVTTEVEDFALEADRTIVVSALTNLLKNAVKFTGDGGHVVVKAGSAGDRAVFEVGDQCGGIPEDFLPRLFEPFVQARSDKGGSGLGLVIVKQAAEAHRGSVRVDNRPGEGCRFVLDLPLRQ